MPMDTRAEPVRERRYRWLFALTACAALIAFLIVRERQNAWYHVISFGGEVGYFRVDGGPPQGVGSMAGLIGRPGTIHVKVGDAVDLHLDGYGPIRSSNGRVLRSRINLFASYQTFEAVTPGAAALTTSAREAVWGCAGIWPVPSDTPEDQRTGEKCPVLSVVVSN